MLPQLGTFIDSFNSLVINNGVNVITGSAGNMNIYLPGSTSEVEGEQIKERLRIIDGVINSRIKSLNILFKEAESLNYTQTQHNSVILDKLSEFNRLKTTYIHRL